MKITEIRKCNVCEKELSLPTVVYDENSEGLTKYAHLSCFVSQQKQINEYCSCPKNDLVDLVMFCSNCGRKVPQNKHTDRIGV